MLKWIFKDSSWKCELVDLVISAILMLIGYFTTVYVSTLTNDIVYVFGTAYFIGMIYMAIPQCKKWVEIGESV